MDKSPSPSGRGQGEGLKIRIDFSLGFALSGSRFARLSPGASARWLSRRLSQRKSDGFSILTFYRSPASTVLPVLTPGLRWAAFADRLLLAEWPVAEARPRSSPQGKAGDGAAGVLHEFDLIPEQCCGQARFRLCRERLYVARSAKTQDKQFAVA